jgi:opacity protein-like surface antigen
VLDVGSDGLPPVGTLKDLVMGSFRALVLAGAVALAGAGMAQAADLLPAPPPVEPFAASGPDFSGWYLRGDVGVGVSDLGKMSSTLAPGIFAPDYRYDRASLQDAAIVGIGVGYQFNNWFRADVTGEYRSAQGYDAATSYANYVPAGAAGGVCGDTGANPRCFDFYHGSVTSGVLLANGYVDLGNYWGLTPFIGGGVGVAYNRIGSIYDNSVGNTGGGVSGSVSRADFAWALMAGLDWTVNPRLKMELSYRYLNLGKVASGPIVCQAAAGCGNEVQNFQLASQDIRLGMRWMFADEAAPPPPPIITKY